MKKNFAYRKNNCFPLSLFLAYIYLIFWAVPYDVYASQSDEAEFDSSFLQHAQGRPIIDVRRFSYNNPIPAGQYYSDIYLNGEKKGQTNLYFSDTSKSGSATLCATPEFISTLDLTADILKEYENKKITKDNCIAINQIIPLAKTHFKLSTLRLDVEIPQALIAQRPRGYISPNQWQSGVPAAFVKYDVNHYQYRSSGTENRQTYLGFRTGFNFAGWAFRHRGNESWSNGDASGYRSIETNLQHDIPMLRGQLTLGDFTTSGQLTDSISLRGMQLASDDRMLPSSQRGYAPVVQGIANNNARVTVWQNGNIIYETTVPGGPFTINDLYPSGYGGDLTVQVTESNGQVRSFTVPFASVAQLVRPGYARYQLAIGRYRYSNETIDDVIFQGTLQYGLFNDITLNSGLTTAPHYTAGLIGLAFNTPYGAIASDITLSDAKLTNSDTTHKGYSLHTSYNIRVPETSTNITLAAYRYSSKDYYSLRDIMWANNTSYIDNTTIKYTSYRPRNQFQLSINQNMGENNGNIYLAGTTYSYWNQLKNSNEYQIGYSNFFRQVNYQLGYSKSQNNNTGRSDERVYFNFAIPLGDGPQTPLLSTTLNYNQNGNNSAQTAISGTLGSNNQYSYGISANTQKNHSSGYSVNGRYRSPFAVLSSSAGNDSNHNRQFSFGASGAIVMHPYGLTLSNDLSDTFTIIHANGANGAAINNAPGNRLDYWGNGIMPYVTPYAINRISIDPSDLPLNVELSATEREVIPRANSITLVNFTTNTGTTMLFDITTNDGSFPPMASEAFNEKGQSVGYVVQGGRLFTKGLAEKGRLEIVWGTNNTEKCTFDYKTQIKPSSYIPDIQPVTCIKNDDTTISTNKKQPGLMY